MTEQWHDVAAFRDLADGAMIGADIGDTHLVLIREGETVRALQGNCPHAGAKLEGGNLCAGHLVCPWHMATFRIDDGALLAPPALSSLARFATRIEAGRILVELTAEPVPMPSPSREPAKVVIVGSGAGAAAAAVGLRDAGYSGVLTMIGPDEAEPIDRTQLTKMALSGQKKLDALGLFAPARVEQLDITRVLAHVQTIDMKARSVTTDEGEVYAFDRCIVATGSQAVRPDFAGADDPRVFTIRSKADVEKLREHMTAGAQAVVLGTSFIGLEAASALRAAGVAVTVIGKSKAPFLDLFGPRIAAAIQNLHEKNDVKFVLGGEVRAIEPQENRLDVVLSSGTRIAAHFAIAGYGVTPNIALFGDVAQAEDGGIAVDRMLQVQEGVFAIGDIASVPGADGKRLRIEHWRVAEQHGLHAAKNALGAGEAFTGVPFFWTQQHGKRLVYIGHASEWDDVTIDGDPDAMQFIAWYIKDEKVAAALLCGKEHASTVLIDAMSESLTLAGARAMVAEGVLTTG